jgi:hypothetical protein
LRKKEDWVGKRRKQKGQDLRRREKEKEKG